MDSKQVSLLLKLFLTIQSSEYDRVLKNNIKLKQLIYSYDLLLRISFVNNLTALTKLISKWKNRIYFTPNNTAIKYSNPGRLACK